MISSLISCRSFFLHVQNVLVFIFSFKAWVHGGWICFYSCNLLEVLLGLIYILWEDTKQVTDGLKCKIQLGNSRSWHFHACYFDLTKKLGYQPYGTEPNNNNNKAINKWKYFWSKKKRWLCLAHWQRNIKISRKVTRNSKNITDF